jgi:hypothetical protein
MGKDSTPKSIWDTAPIWSAEHPGVPKVATPMKKYGTMDAIIPDDVTQFIHKQLKRQDVEIRFTYGGSSQLGNLQYKVFDKSGQHIGTLSECSKSSSPSNTGWKLNTLIQ